MLAIVMLQLNLNMHNLFTKFIYLIILSPLLHAGEADTFASPMLDVLRSSETMSGNHVLALIDISLPMCQVAENFLELCCEHS